MSKEPTAAKAKMMLTIALFNGAFAIYREDDMAFGYWIDYLQDETEEERADARN